MADRDQGEAMAGENMLCPEEVSVFAIFEKPSLNLVM